MRGAKDAPALNPVVGETGLSSVRNGLDTLSGKLDSLEDLARFLAMEVQGDGHSEAAGSFFSIMNLVEYCKNEANQLLDRLMEVERADAERA